jgi:aryl-alcohol dehydrogenase-like predicted oxidoreductase
MGDLPTRQLGRTGLLVTTLGYGTMELRNEAPSRDTSEEQAELLLNRVLDSGINFIDTSVDYGQAEERIGRHISHRRSEYILATKCGCLSGALLTNAPKADRTSRLPHIFTPANITHGLEQSLTRMRTDYVDLVQFHISPSREQLIEEGGLECLKDLQRQGLVRWIGMSGIAPNLTDHIEMGVFDEFQIPYSAMQRDHEDLITAAADTGAGIVIRGGAAKGGPGKETGKMWDVWQSVNLADLQGDMSRQQFILRFTLSHPHVDTTIVGTINPDHLDENVAVAKLGSLPHGVYEEAKQRLAAAGVGPNAATAKS